MNKSLLLVKITYILVSTSHAKCWPFKYWWSALSSKMCKKIRVHPLWRSYVCMYVCKWMPKETKNVNCVMIFCQWWCFKAQTHRKQFVMEGSDPTVDAEVCNMSTSHRARPLIEQSSLVEFLLKSGSAFPIFFRQFFRLRKFLLISTFLHHFSKFIIFLGICFFHYFSTIRHFIRHVLFHTIFSTQHIYLGYLRFMQFFWYRFSLTTFFT